MVSWWQDDRMVGVHSHNLGSTIKKVDIFECVVKAGEGLRNKHCIEEKCKKWWNCRSGVKVLLELRMKKTSSGVVMMTPDYWKIALLSKLDETISGNCCWSPLFFLAGMPPSSCATCCSANNELLGYIVCACVCFMLLCRDAAVIMCDVLQRI